MSEYNVYSGCISYGATGEGETQIFYACRAYDERSFRQKMGATINKYYSITGRMPEMYDVDKQPPAWKADDPSTHGPFEYHDAASWYMTGAKIYHGMPEDDYVYDYLVTPKYKKYLEKQVAIDNGSDGFSAELEVFLITFFNYS